MAEQLIFDLPVRPALGRAAFFVSDSNAIALATLDRWADWPLHKLVLQGPEASGKTHLAHVWVQDVEAQIVAATDLVNADLPAWATQPLVVEDIDHIAGQADAEQMLFHLHNLMQAAGQPLLMTRREPPSAFALPDLTSRIEATALAHLNPPDDALLTAVLVKLFDDRQLHVTKATLPFLLRRIDRSFAAAQEMVNRLDAAALAENRAITRDLARDLLDKDGPKGA